MQDLTPSCDIFCRVIDHLGDAGVTWRLARQLAGEYGWRVRLIIDDPSPIPFFSPNHRDLPIEVIRWDESLTRLAVADVVIEAFACDPPPAYVERMAQRQPFPVWINLEYLSAEGWVVGCHGLPSPQAGGLTKHFFFPGFVPGTGGLLREQGLRFPPPPAANGLLRVSLFCYDNPRLPFLLSAWAREERPIHCLVTEGLARKQVESWLGQPFPVGSRLQRNALTLEAVSFLPQDDYDRLLASCHLNFVRGEDSFVRAQWAERPFVWQAYPQEGNVHLRKLAAFLSLYQPEEGVVDFFRAWNGAGTLDWHAFSAHLNALQRRASGWARQIRAAGNLTENLVKFCRERL